MFAVRKMTISLSDPVDASTINAQFRGIFDISAHIRSVTMHTFFDQSGTRVTEVVSKLPAEFPHNSSSTALSRWWLTEQYDATEELPDGMHFNWGGVASINEGATINLACRDNGGTFGDVIGKGTLCASDKPHGLVTGHYVSTTPAPAINTTYGVTVADDVRFLADTAGKTALEAGNSLSTYRKYVKLNNYSIVGDPKHLQLQTNRPGPTRSSTYDTTFLTAHADMGLSEVTVVTATTLNPDKVTFDNTDWDISLTDTSTNTQYERKLESSVFAVGQSTFTLNTQLPGSVSQVSYSMTGPLFSLSGLAAVGGSNTIGLESASVSGTNWESVLVEAPDDLIYSMDNATSLTVSRPDQFSTSGSIYVPAVSSVGYYDFTTSGSSVQLANPLSGTQIEHPPAIYRVVRATAGQSGTHITTMGPHGLSLGDTCRVTATVNPNNVLNPFLVVIGVPSESIITVQEDLSTGPCHVKKVNRVSSLSSPGSSTTIQLTTDHSIPVGAHVAIRGTNGYDGVDEVTSVGSGTITIARNIPDSIDLLRTTVEIMYDNLLYGDRSGNTVTTKGIHDLIPFDYVALTTGDTATRGVYRVSNVDYGAQLEIYNTLELDVPWSGSASNVVLQQIFPAIPVTGITSVGGKLHLTVAGMIRRRGLGSKYVFSTPGLGSGECTRLDDTTFSTTQDYTGPATSVVSGYVVVVTNSNTVTRQVGSLDRLYASTQDRHRLFSGMSVSLWYDDLTFDTASVTVYNDKWFSIRRLNKQVKYVAAIPNPLVTATPDPGNASETILTTQFGHAITQPNSLRLLWITDLDNVWDTATIIDSNSFRLATPLTPPTATGIIAVVPPGRVLHPGPRGNVADGILDKSIVFAMTGYGMGSYIELDPAYSRTDPGIAEIVTSYQQSVSSFSSVTTSSGSWEITTNSPHPLAAPTNPDTRYWARVKIGQDISTRPVTYVANDKVEIPQYGSEQVSINNLSLEFVTVPAESIINQIASKLYLYRANIFDTTDLTYETTNGKIGFVSSLDIVSDTSFMGPPNIVKLSKQYTITERLRLSGKIANEDSEPYRRVSKLGVIPVIVNDSNTTMFIRVNIPGLWVEHAGPNDSVVVSVTVEPMGNIEAPAFILTRGSLFMGSNRSFHLATTSFDNRGISRFVQALDYSPKPPVIGGLADTVYSSGVSSEHTLHWVTQAGSGILTPATDATRSEVVQVLLSANDKLSQHGLLVVRNYVQATQVDNQPIMLTFIASNDNGDWFGNGLAMVSAASQDGALSGAYHSGIRYMSEKAGRPFIARYFPSELKRYALMTGHSLGGGIAKYLTAKLQSRIEPKYSAIVSYGAPQVTDQRSASAFTTVGIPMYNFIIPSDPVPYLLLKGPTEHTVIFLLVTLLLSPISIAVPVLFQNPRRMFTLGSYAYLLRGVAGEIAAGATIGTALGSLVRTLATFRLESWSSYIAMGATGIQAFTRRFSGSLLPDGIPHPELPFAEDTSLRERGIIAVSALLVFIVRLHLQIGGGGGPLYPLALAVAGAVGARTTTLVVSQLFDVLVSRVISSLGVSLAHPFIRGLGRAISWAVTQVATFVRWVTTSPPLSRRRSEFTLAVSALLFTIVTLMMYILSARISNGYLWISLIILMIFVVETADINLPSQTITRATRLDLVKAVLKRLMFTIVRSLMVVFGSMLLAYGVTDYHIPEHATQVLLDTQAQNVYSLKGSEMSGSALTHRAAFDIGKGFQMHSRYNVEIKTQAGVKRPFVTPETGQLIVDGATSIITRHLLSVDTNNLSLYSLIPPHLFSRDSRVYDPIVVDIDVGRNVMRVMMESLWTCRTRTLLRPLTTFTGPLPDVPSHSPLADPAAHFTIVLSGSFTKTTGETIVWSLAVDSLVAETDGSGYVGPIVLSFVGPEGADPASPLIPAAAILGNKVPIHGRILEEYGLSFYQGCFPSLYTGLQTWLHHYNQEVYITGFGQGGGFAQTCAIALKTFMLVDDVSDFYPQRICTVTFASPPIGDKILQETYYYSCLSTQYVLPDDLAGVIRLPHVVPEDRVDPLLDNTLPDFTLRIPNDPVIRQMDLHLLIMPELLENEKVILLTFQVYSDIKSINRYQTGRTLGKFSLSRYVAAISPLLKHEVEAIEAYSLVTSEVPRLPTLELDRFGSIPSRSTGLYPTNTTNVTFGAPAQGNRDLAVYYQTNTVGGNVVLSNDHAILHDTMSQLAPSLYVLPNEPNLPPGSTVPLVESALEDSRSFLPSPETNEVSATTYGQTVARVSQMLTSQGSEALFTDIISSI